MEGKCPKPGDTKQHHHPCAECPFSRKSPPGGLGGSDVHTYVGQTAHPFVVPCHSVIDYDDPGWAEASVNGPQCVGHAIVQERMGLAPAIAELNDRMEESGSSSLRLLVMAEYSDAAGAVTFDTLQEFVSHHASDITEAFDADSMKQYVAACVQREVAKAASGIRNHEDGGEMEFVRFVRELQQQEVTDG